MEQYVGLDVSLKETSICVLDGSGETVWQGEVSTSVETLARSIRRKAPGAVRIGLESGLLSTWLWHGLRGLGLPVVCLDARHAKSGLSMQVNNATMRRGWRRSCAPAGIARSRSRAWNVIRFAPCYWPELDWSPCGAILRTRYGAC